MKINERRANSSAAKLSKRGRPKASARSLAATRQLLIDAGGRAYAEFGYDRVTMAHILAEAGVSRPTLYKYFANKHDIIQALTQQALQQLLLAIRHGVNAVSTPLEQVDRAVDAYLCWGAKQGPVCCRFYSEMDHAQSPIATLRQTLMQQLNDYFEQQLQIINRPLPDRLMLDALVSAVEFVGSQYFKNNDYSASQQSRCQRVIMRILLASLAQEDELQLLPPVPMQVG
ncbi:MAG: TetR/AcrR family transcriptional regulator [Hahellaceae bacterium]|nr:TetR/AcrR family transcriptional regulator [Hahellaceae bacterium]MCP5211524.1 TetR/AcrR family transcriptional regulator [Hahellaceae bacterium]